MRAIHLAELDMFVYLFGDQHVEDNECSNGTDISDYLQGVIENHLATFYTIPIDVFFEYVHERNLRFGGELPGEICERAGSIKRTYDRLKMLKSRYEKEHEGRARIHFTDYRIYPRLGDYENKIREINIEMRKYKNNFYQYVQKKRRALLEILDYEIKREEGSRIRKQYEAIESDYLKDHIIKYLIEYSTTVDDVELAKVYEPLLTKGTDIEVMHAAYEVNVHQTCIYMDMFTMFRMFRSFNTPDENMKRCKHCIVYAGDSHIRAIWYVLTKLGHLKPRLMWYQPSMEMSNNYDLQCFSIPIVFRNMWHAYEYYTSNMDKNNKITVTARDISNKTSAILVYTVSGNTYKINTLDCETDIIGLIALEYLILSSTLHNRQILMHFNRNKIQNEGIQYLISLFRRSNFAQITQESGDLVLYRSRASLHSIIYKLQLRHPLGG